MSGPAKILPERTAIEEDAIRLLLLLDADPSEEVRSAVRRWVEQDPRHGIAFAKARRSWTSSERLKACPPDIGDEEVARVAGGIEAFFTRPAIIALVIVSCVLGIFLTIGSQAAWKVDRYWTRIGESRTVVLADGTRVLLASGTMLEVAAGKTAPSIHLIKGEILVRSGRPHAARLRVRAIDASIVAANAEFDVRIRPQLVDVVAVRGAVSVAERGEGELHIPEGQRAMIRFGAVATSTMTHQAIARRLAWRRGMIDLEQDTLAQAVEEFNRYRSKPLVIGAPELNGLLVTGRFRVGGASAFLTTLKTGYHVDAISGMDGSILLVPSKPSAK